MTTQPVPSATSSQLPESLRPWAARLFAWRGQALVLPAIIALWSARAQPPALGCAAPLLLAGLALRCWASSHLGALGRTRSAAGPEQRVVSGPYRLLKHPLYTANLALALGLLLALQPPWMVTLLLAVGITAFYGVLAARENTLLAGLGAREPSPPLPLARVARLERSTWLSLATVLLLACC